MNQNSSSRSVGDSATQASAARATTMLLFALSAAALHPPASSLRVPASSSRAARIDACTQLGVRETLTETLREIPNRGLDQHDNAYKPPEYPASILELVAALEDTGWPTNQAEDWMVANCFFSTTWRLAYTSSRTFARYGGLSSYAERMEGVSTPDLYMRITRSPQLVFFEEPLRDAQVNQLCTPVYRSRVKQKQVTHINTRPEQHHKRPREGTIPSLSNDPRWRDDGVSHLPRPGGWPRRSPTHTQTPNTQTTTDCTETKKQSPNTGAHANNTLHK